jgi:hypothetical protein
MGGPNRFWETAAPEPPAALAGIIEWGMETVMKAPDAAGSGLGPA